MIVTGDPEKEENYQSICGGLPPMKIKSLKIEGKETGIDRLDEILAGVAQLKLKDSGELRDALLAVARQFNYIPPKMGDAYSAALLEEYKKRIVD